eukprot:13917062-Alexandrium_andersonii.AAC.1
MSGLNESAPPHASAHGSLAGASGALAQPFARKCRSRCGNGKCSTRVYHQLAGGPLARECLRPFGGA